MIRTIRRLRRGLLQDNRLGKYLLYASGEIALVIIGILVALYLNDLSDAHKDRVRELAHLRNIQSDMRLNIAETDKFLAARGENIAAAKRILGYFDGKPIADYSAFNRDAVGIYSWRRFYLANNTFQELVNSGNLGAISDTGIKHQLLDIEALYQQMKSEEDHFRYDTEKLIYEPIYRLMDLEPIVDEYAFHASGGQAGRDLRLAPAQFDDYFKSVEIKNGFVMTVLEFDTMNGQMRTLRAKCEALIARIDAEMAAPRR